MNQLAKISTLATLFFLTQNCTQNNIASPGNGQSPVAKAVAMSNPELAAPIGFDQYWFQGKAEVSTYRIEQERYGETRAGLAVTVFVTEDFSEKKQVKLDDAPAAGTDRVPILKLNLVKKYTTGIYDYSMLQSVFTPIDWKARPQSLKSTATVQEWCGHVFTQIGLADGGKNWRLREFSYFEKEGDIDQKLPAVMLEDEIWTRLRIDPASIPVGDVELLPASFYSRLKHQRLKPEAATVSVQTVDGQGVVSVKYKNIARELAIRFEGKSPFRIVGWEELVGGKPACRATLQARVLSDYWTRHNNDDLPMRDTLGLPR